VLALSIGLLLRWLDALPPVQRPALAEAILKTECQHADRLDTPTLSARTH
jgi:hypothetical protein